MNFNVLYTYLRTMFPKKYILYKNLINLSIKI